MKPFNQFLKEASSVWTKNRPRWTQHTGAFCKEAITWLLGQGFELAHKKSYYWAKHPKFPGVIGIEDYGDEENWSWWSAQEDCDNNGIPNFRQWSQSADQEHLDIGMETLKKFVDDQMHGRPVKLNYGFPKE